MAELDQFLDFAREAAEEAGRLTLGYYRRTLEVIGKDDGSPVTIADREAEQLLRARIEAAFPDHGILGEEYGARLPADGCVYTWSIDPIDGTKSFIHGVPLYTNLLALLREGEPVVGVINVPALGEQVAAAEGRGCFLNGRRVRVSAVDSLAEALFVYTDHRDLERNAPNDRWKTLVARCKYPRGWCDAYGYGLVATGRAEIMVDPVVAPYDVAPMPVILREAGGAFFNWDGGCRLDGITACATNGALRDEVLAVLSGG